MDSRVGSRNPAGPRGRGRKGTCVQGFTLLEVMVATVLVTTASLVAFPTVLSFIDLSQAARQENIATHDLMAAAEDLVATPFSRLLTTYVPGQPIPKFDDLHLTGERIVVLYEDPDAIPLSITLVATWSDRKGRPRQEVFRCMRVP